MRQLAIAFLVGALGRCLARGMGRCGPAAPLLACSLAIHGLGLRQGWQNQGEQPQPLAHNNALIIALAPLGQCVVVVLAGEQP